MLISESARAGGLEAEMEPSGNRAEHEREELRRRYRDQLGQYKSANAELADISWTLAELEQQIATLEAEEQAAPTAPLTRRISDLRRWRSSLEEHVLRHMYRAEAIAAEVALLRAALHQQGDAER
jgi:predicted  nucleic acid-binding Zn-ribbon protein